MQRSSELHETLVQQRPHHPSTHLRDVLLPEIEDEVIGQVRSKGHRECTAVAAVLLLPEKQQENRKGDYIAIRGKERSSRITACPQIHVYHAPYTYFLLETDLGKGGDGGGLHSPGEA